MDNSEKAILKKRGDLIYKFRLKNNLSQAQMAKDLGLAQPVVSNAERGLYSKTQDKVILLIVETYKVDEDYFYVKQFNKLKEWDLAIDSATKNIHDEKSGDKPLANIDSGALNKYFILVEGSLSKAKELKAYLDETSSKKLEKEKLQVIVNEIITILNLKNHI